MGEESFVGASLMKVYIGADCTRSKGSLLKVFNTVGRPCDNDSHSLVNV